MPTTFIHTADWHLGKAFHGIPDDDKRAGVRQARFDAIRRIGDVARQRNAAFVVVAGDRHEELGVKGKVGLGSWDESLSDLGLRLRSRLRPGQRERPGRTSAPNWTIQHNLSMSETTLANLEQLAEDVSTSERSVSPMQVAALLVKDSATAPHNHSKTIP